MTIAVLLGSVMLVAGSQPNSDVGKWACIARSTYGTHGTTSVWSDYEATERRAHDSAVQKCLFSATNKRDCRVDRCWVKRD